MSDPSLNDTQKPAPEAVSPEALTPEALAILKRARRSFGISVGILLLGFMAIGFALVYRVMRDAPPEVMAETIVLPAGASILSSVLADGAVNVTYEINGGTVLGVYDRATGALVQQIALQSE